MKLHATIDDARFAAFAGCVVACRNAVQRSAGLRQEDNP
jgi:hypothetical protein